MAPIQIIITIPNCIVLIPIEDMEMIPMSTVTIYHGNDNHNIRIIWGTIEFSFK